jgi:hypothetical protein
MIEPGRHGGPTTGPDLTRDGDGFGPRPVRRRAAAAARRALRILELGFSIEPLLSTTKTTAFSAPATAGRPPLDSILMMALTSVAPSGRYSFW